ncbi:hypothetical protein [Devosia indica]
MKNLRLAAITVATGLILAACGDAPPPADAAGSTTEAPATDAPASQ